MKNEFRSNVNGANGQLVVDPKISYELINITMHARVKGYK